jgi:hypothetical protein
LPDYYLLGAPPAVFYGVHLPGYPWPKVGWFYGALNDMIASWSNGAFPPVLLGPVTWTTYPFFEYNFIPNKADLDQSGHVDITDLSAIAKQYGNTTSNEYDVEFAKLSTLGAGTGLPVDLLDVVYVAKYFCKDITPKDPHTGLLYDP